MCNKRIMPGVNSVGPTSGFSCLLAVLMIVFLGVEAGARPAQRGERLGLFRPSEPSVLGDDTESLQRLVHAGARGTPLAQHSLAEHLNLHGSRYNSMQWLQIVRAIFGGHEPGWKLGRPLRRAVIAHIRAEPESLAASSLQALEGSRSQRSAIFGLAGAGGAEDLRALHSLLRGRESLSTLAAAALAVHGHELPEGFEALISGPQRASSPRNQPSASVASAENIWGVRRRVSEALQRGAPIDIEPQRVDEWLASQSAPWVALGAWIASLRRPRWAEKVVATGRVEEIASLATNAALLSDEVFVLGAARLSELAAGPLRAVLGFSLVRMSAANLVPTKTLRLLARSEPRLGPLAMRALSARCAPSLLSLIRASLEDPDPVMRAHGANGLQYAAASCAKPLLRERYEQEEDDVVRRVVVAAMSRVGGKAAHRLLAEARSLDPDPLVRQLAGLKSPVGDNKPEPGRLSFQWLKLTNRRSSEVFGFVSAFLSSGVHVPIWGPPGQVVLVVGDRAYAPP